MRKLCLSLLAISFFIFIFCGCTTQSKAQPQFDFTSQCKVGGCDEGLTLNVVSSEEDNVYIEVVSEGTVKGLSYERVNSTLYIDYKGLRCNTSADYLPVFNPFSILIDALVSAKSSEIEYICTDKGCDVYKVKGDSSEYMIFVNSKNGTLVKIKPINVQYEYLFC